MILITGATGNVGRHVVNLLLEEGQKVVAVTRDPTPAQLPAGAQVVSGDLSRPKWLRSALRGVETIFLVPRAVGDAAAELLSLAAEQGVQRVVLVSAVTVEYPAGEERFAADFKAVEDAVRASGLQWTFLRCADFDSNTLAWAPQIRATGIVRAAYGDAATSPIDPRDIAAVGVVALLNAKHAGRSYVLTGPQQLSQRDRVRLIGEATGRELTWEEISPQQVRQAMIAQGVPEDIPERLLGSLASYAQQPGPSSDTVEQVLGRPALTFAQWAADHAAAFRN
jgi:uncharacterized protein YbjT (DUF2867 family)